MIALVTGVEKGEDGLFSRSSSEVSEEDEIAGNERPSDQESDGRRISTGSDYDSTAFSPCSVNSEVTNESERSSLSDIELIEGLDVDSNNLPDVDMT
ncbi:hypothetical protein RB195_018870 [Necator americanus]|uniref:Uncharacterized protein n=1 Tax=Necator americanus TaxID=51031 RepID=A0ABR1CBL1_NECAM